MNVFNELESFFQINNLKWDDVLSAEVVKENWTGFSVIGEEVTLLENYTDDDLKSFKNKLKDLNYNLYDEDEDISGYIWLTERRLIKRDESDFSYSLRWKITKLSNRPNSIE